MSKKHNSSSIALHNRTKGYICTREGCNNPVKHHLVSIDIHIHKICSACPTCKKRLDRMADMENGDTSAISNHKEGKIKSLKVRENGKGGLYTVEFWGPFVSEFQAAGMGWMEIYD